MIETQRPAAVPRRILVVDDDAGMRDSLDDLLSAAGWHVTTVGRAVTALARLPEVNPDVVLADVRMPGMSGLELLRELAKPEMPPVVLISAHGDIAMAVSAVQEGAYSFVEKPYDPHRLLSVVQHAADQFRLAADTRRLRARLASLSGLDRILLGQTEEIRALRRDVIDLADSNAPVLIVGETGTGKELVARALHDLGARPGGPFVPINCATLEQERFEPEMFGAKDGPRGFLLAADRGSLFLDEICSCPERVQAKLLRAIETGSFNPVGAAGAASSDFRLISASNLEPEQAVRDGLLRADVFYRINTFVLRLSPLRQRLEDLPLLYSHFLDEFALVYEIEPPQPSHEDMAALLAHDWPGNVRELRHVAERHVLAARRGRGSAAEAISYDQQRLDVPGTLREAVAAFEREMVGRAIRAHAGRMDAAAEALGIGRRTLNEKIVKLGLDKDTWL